MARLLIIDDDQVLRRALVRTFRKMGHEVYEACDGRDGLQTFEIESIDLVITDLIMPELEGMETIRQLKRLCAGLPIIAISGGGRGQAENYLRIAEQLGASRTFAKPFEFSTINAAVAALLSEKISRAG